MTPEREKEIREYQDQSWFIESVGIDSNEGLAIQELLADLDRIRGGVKELEDDVIRIGRGYERIRTQNQILREALENSNHAEWCPLSESEGCECHKKVLTKADGIGGAG